MFKKQKYLDLLYYTVIFFISIYSFYFGKEYSLFHTDLIHWNFQLETILSFINGKQLYKEIFLQYGEGIVTTLSVINLFYKIDLYSLGIISSIIFALRFFVIYKKNTQRIKNIPKNSRITQKFNFNFFCIYLILFI